jgi:hypothetical protein
MSKVETTYACDICGEKYRTNEEAVACEARGFEPKFKVGQIVTSKQGFGWYDGDKSWIVNPDITLRPEKCPNGNRNCFECCCTYVFYYVITFIDGDEREGHKPRYHLRTKAMTGKQGYSEGWTFDEGHYKPMLVRNPPKIVVEQSKELLGKPSGYLL